MNMENETVLLNTTAIKIEAPKVKKKPFKFLKFVSIIYIVWGVLSLTFMKMLFIGITPFIAIIPKQLEHFGLREEMWGPNPQTYVQTLLGIAAILLGILGFKAVSWIKTGRKEGKFFWMFLICLASVFTIWNWVYVLHREWYFFHSFPKNGDHIQLIFTTAWLFSYIYFFRSFLKQELPIEANVTDKRVSRFKWEYVVIALILIAGGIVHQIVTNDYENSRGTNTFQYSPWIDQEGGTHYPSY